MQKPASSSYNNKTLFPAMRLGRALLFIDGCELGIIGEPLAFPNPKLFSPPEVAMASLTAIRYLWQLPYFSLCLWKWPGCHDVAKYEWAKAI